METEVQSALCTAAAITKDLCQSFLICSDTKDKDKDTVAAFLFALYENHLFPSNQVDVKRSSGVMAPLRNSRINSRSSSFTNYRPSSRKSFHGSSPLHRRVKESLMALVVGQNRWFDKR